jgi:hypothetical protein
VATFGTTPFYSLSSKILGVPLAATCGTTISLLLGSRLRVPYNFTNQVNSKVTYKKHGTDISSENFDQTLLAVFVSSTKDAVTNPEHAPDELRIPDLLWVEEIAGGCTQ